MKSCVLLVLAVLSIGSPVSAPTQAPDLIPVETRIPIQRINLPSGGRYFALPLQVGQEHLFAAIDTGSSGLRVLAPALRPDDYDAADGIGRMQFASGTILTGPRVKAQVAFGSVHGLATIQVVDRVTCGPHVPHCAEGNMPLQQLGLMGGGIPGQGAPAILGASIIPLPVGGPFPELSVKRWIFDIPNDLGEGQLTLNPSDASLRGFVRLPYVHGPSMPRDGLRGCLTNLRTAQAVCGVILFDTGAPGISVESAAPLPKGWPTGTPASFTFQDESGMNRLRQTFVVGDPKHSTRLHFDFSPTAQNTIIHANASPYFCFDVMYEADREALSLRPRRSGRHDPQAEEVHTP